MTTNLTLKDMAKLARIKTTDLAQQLNMEYGLVSTAMSMDEKGETPKRKSVAARQQQIREHLESMLKIEQRDGADDPKRKADLWDSVGEAARRYPAPRGCAQVHEYGDHTLGSYVRLELDPGTPPTLYRFLRVVTVERTGAQYVDVIGGENGACRSIALEELDRGKRVWP